MLKPVPSATYRWKEPRPSERLAEAEAGSVMVGAAKSEQAARAIMDATGSASSAPRTTVRAGPGARTQRE